MKSLSPAQSAAIRARGNVLLEAGAGSGKTSTLVARCLDRLFSQEDPVGIDEILMVTFTEAAATEMRRRIREALDQKLTEDPRSQRIHELLAQLDQARIGTLHGFCLGLVREHFHELGMDPQSRVLEPGEARLLAHETVVELMNGHFVGAGPGSAAVLGLVQAYGEGDDQPIRELVLSVHRYLQTLPNPARWLGDQTAFWTHYNAAAWKKILDGEVRLAIPDWLERLESQPAENTVACRCADLLRDFVAGEHGTQTAALLGEIADFRAEEHWPRGTKGRFRDPILPVLEDAAALASFASDDPGRDPLFEDFSRVQPHALAILDLAREFGEAFAARKRLAVGLDFSDLEQFSLRLLENPASGALSATARRWQTQFREVFVDEYQDINEVQDRIIAALSRSGPVANRFLVGDVKQSIYGFRLARPDIFLRYSQEWRGSSECQVLQLSENFRSHESILDFINRCFGSLMRKDIGGVDYPDEARLRLGDPAARAAFMRNSNPDPRVELLVHFAQRSRAGRDSVDESDDEEQSNAEQEATLAAARLSQMKHSGCQVYDRATKKVRPVEWRDMAILLRAVAGKAEIFARAFNRAGIPLVAEQKGFFETVEIGDLSSLLMLLDNPRQDIPLLAVLRSPLVGLSPDDLVAVRMAAPGETSFWAALNRHHALHADSRDTLWRRVDAFLDRLHRWRAQSRHGALSQCLEDILDTTHYPAWLATQSRGVVQAANVRRFLELARHYDSWQGRGLHRFLEYMWLMSDNGEGPESAPPRETNAVRLMTVHASKGLEFPVVLLGDLNKPFRHDGPSAGFVVDDQSGICAEVIDDTTRARYPSLALVRASRQQKQRLLAEEIRLLYVAMTRACDWLILLGTTTENRARQAWSSPAVEPAPRSQFRDARSPLELLGPILPDICERSDWYELSGGKSKLINWQILRDDEALPMATAPKVAAQTENPISRLIKFARASSRLEFRYPFLAATQRAGKTTVTRIRRQLAELQETESDEMFRSAGPPARTHRADGPSAAQIGTAYHALFQNVVLSSVTDVTALKRELERLVGIGQLGLVEGRLLDLNRVAGFWSGSVGRQILSRQNEIHRELEFTISLSVRELEDMTAIATAEGSPNSVSEDRVIVQGIIDLAVIGPAEIWIVDYKTDHIEAKEASRRSDRYRPQLDLYRRAMEQIYRRPVTHLWLHFLQPDVTINLEKVR